MAQSQSVIKVAKDAKRVCDEVMNVCEFSQAQKKQKKAENEKIVVDEIEEAASTSSINTNNDDKDDDGSGPLQLDNINHHCLRHIFEYLSLHDQIKMAELDDHFIFPAVEAFSCRYRAKRIEALVSSKPAVISSGFGYLRIDSAVAMAGLQHFGARMSRLSANFNAFRLIAPAKRHAIDLAILKNCSDSLKTLEIRFSIESHFETIEKQFKKVENLVIDGSTLGTTFGQLNKWFPNLIDLKLAGVQFLQPAAIETRFAHLTALNIVNDIDAQISDRTICEILLLNGQLNTLKLRCDCGADVLMAIAENLKRLESLELWMPTDGFACYTAKQKISLKMLKTLTLRVSAKNVAIKRMPFVLENVNELRLYGFDQYHRLIVNLITSGDQLNMISMVPSEQYGFPSLTPSPYDYEALKQAILTRKHLKELAFCVDKFIGDDLMRFMDDECKHVEVWRVMTSNVAILQALLMRTSNGSSLDLVVDKFLTNVGTNGFTFHLAHLTLNRHK